MKLDDTDISIIGLLKDNARLSIRDIAKVLQLRPSTVHVRLTKLKDNNIIEKYTLKLNNAAINEAFIVFIFIATEQLIPNAAFKNDHIKEVFGITGEYDLVMKCKFKDIAAFNLFILDFRKKYGLKKTLTQVVTIALKEEL